ncbi:type I phosphomannose isomerase catalytic subunit [Flavobacterium sp. SUN046]|uniref:type I phosphomannose isomerase catalytic subunit n=1 Tax=Flavobacterium sp. SUN046 TaxID=3002440 RepID=UPI002DBAB225|nr:type I phosphomannose isomerase catalytic subunit [Flavobacterium sp. SUN046]MEC4050845.1 type I phosphomannose isomerase catalytic subunit [Flavobacterium sp. SUN046]
MKLYPIQFQSIFKERIWGGTKLKTILNKPISSEITGESWEISSVPNDVSIVANGSLKGKSLNEIIHQFPQEILGAKVFKQFGEQFPLLFKYLDAQEDLSIQVHPNDELALKNHNSFGKTEMWYVMQSEQKSKLIVGFKEKTSKEEFLKKVEDKTLLEVLDIRSIKQGDAFLLETGTVHAIGAGTLIAEIQQTSDITYRIYDFDRKDAEGNTRELHLDYAMEAINFDVVKASREYQKEVNTANQIVDCPYFTTNYIPLDGMVEVNKTNESFTVYMCVSGSFKLEDQKIAYEYTTGDTVLIPANLSSYKLSGNASLLEIYIS